MKKRKQLLLLGAYAIIFLAGCAASEELEPNRESTLEAVDTLEPTAVVSDHVIRVAYCPTMADELSRLNKEGVIIEGIQYPSAAHAVQAIGAGEVDAALIGRKPYTAEISGALAFAQLRDGVTLISAQKKMVPFSNLATLRIHTTLDLQNVDRFFPENTQIIHHTERISVDLLDQNSAVLIDWAELEGNYQLLIPVNEQGQKIPHFRTPFFVYPSSDAEKFQALIEKF